MEYIVDPLSRDDLRRMALQLRTALGLENVLYFPVLAFFEHVMPSFFDGFHYEIVDMHALQKTVHADTDVVNRIIRIREDVYHGAVCGKGRDRMTIMHEIAHYLLLVHCGVKFRRIFNDQPVKKYENPEWQAKALAGEIMCPAHMIGRLSPEEVQERCGVSLEAAKFNVGLLRR